MLASDVQKLSLNFATKINDGHAGARRIWRYALPRLKYHNPTVSMLINRTTVQEGPATITVFFGRSQKSISTYLSPTLPNSLTPGSDLEESRWFERTEIIDMKHLHDSEILSQLMKVTKASQILATPEEEVELRQLKEEEEKSKQDSLVALDSKEKQRQKQALLDEARGLMSS